MRRLVLGFFLLGTTASGAATAAWGQIVPVPVPAPVVDASSAQWFLDGDPIIANGETYYPSGPTVFFNGQTMTKSDEYEGVPVYQDRTLEPFSVMYVPMSGHLMRPYEPRRSGDLAGTAASWTSTLPMKNPAEPSSDQRSRPRPTQAAPVPAPVAVPAPRATSGTSTVLVPRPDQRDNGIYVVFAGARWYSAGTPRQFAPDVFTPIGVYYGFVVYRETNGPSDRIWVPVVANGPLAPYSKR